MSKNCIKQRILDAIKHIPAGDVYAYGDIASMLGLPGRARLVAKVLSESHDVDIPWHRVLRASGHIAFPNGSVLFDEQVRRLQAEGVQVQQGRVKRVSKHVDLDALLWAPN
jgi:methylated-DNA-protein-cysteine methyltransferase-like protein